MTTATTSNYNDNRNEIITDAMIILGVLAAEETASSDDIALGQRFLNRLVKHWEAKGIHVWTNSIATLFLVNGQRQYSLGNASTDDKCANTVVETDLDTALATNATAVTVTSTTGMTVADNIGIVLDNDTIYWTTIATIPSATTLTLTVGVTSSASSGNYVYTFTNKIQRPLRVLDVNRRENLGTSITETMMPGLSFLDYQQLTSKYSTGTPTQWVYDAQLVSGTLAIWPVPTDMTQRLVLHYSRPIYDFDAATDTADLPQEWLQTLVHNLAVVLALPYGKSAILPTLKPLADEMLREVNSYDQEEVSMYITPTRQRY